MDKICLYCGKIIENSYKSQKYCSKCSKEANKKYKHTWYENNKERILKNRRKYFQKHKKEERERTKKWRENNLKRFKEMRKKEREIYTLKYPEKIKAHDKANYYIKIPKGQLCQICKKELATQKHHPDYNKPLIITALCKSCHTKIHGGNQHRNV